MAPKLLKESAPAKLAKSGKRWSAVLGKPGQGSSGFYSEDVFREYGPAALPPGSHAYVGHPDALNPTRNPKDLIGTYPDGGVWNAETLTFDGELEVLPHWEAFVEAVAPHTGLSIYMMGETDDEGNVTALVPNRQNSVDLVSYAGLEGSGIANKLYESAIAFSEQNTVVTPATEKKEGNMEKVLEAIAALDAKFTVFVAETKALAVAGVQAEADADATEKAVESAVASYGEKATAIAAAELLPSQVESLLASAAKGADVAPLIEAAKKIVSEARGFVAESAGTGRVVEGAAGADFTIEGWGK